MCRRLSAFASTAITRAPNSSSALAYVPTFVPISKTSEPGGTNPRKKSINRARKRLSRGFTRLYKLSAARGTPKHQESSSNLRRDAFIARFLLTETVSSYDHSVFLRTAINRGSLATALVSSAAFSRNDGQRHR